MTRTGKDYLESVRDGRTIYLNGQLIENASGHQAFRNAIRTIAGLYDFQAAPENLELMTFESPTSGGRVNRFWQLPSSYDELVRRREAITAWAGLTQGFMGRSPDHVGSCLSGMVMGIDVFKRHDKARAAALLDYFTYVRDNDLFVTYVIANPRADHSKDVSEQEDEFLVAAICDEDSQGNDGQKRKDSAHDLPPGLRRQYPTSGTPAMTSGFPTSGAAERRRGLAAGGGGQPRRLTAGDAAEDGATDD